MTTGVPVYVHWLLRVQWAALAVYAALSLLPVGLVPSFLTGLVLGSSIYALALVAAAARGWVVPSDRSWTWVLAMGISCYLAGNLYFYAWNQRQDVPPFPSWADAGYLGFFPFAVLAVLLSMRARLGRLQGTVLLDGLVGGLAAATAGAFVLRPLVDLARGADPGVLVAAAYPIADVVLVAMVFGVFSAGGGLTGGFYRWLAAGLLTFVLADAIYGFRTTSGSYTPGTLLDVVWGAAFVLVSYSIWRPVSAPRTQMTEGLGSMWIVGASTTVALVTVSADSFVHVPVLVTALSVATLLAASGRTVLAFVRLRQLAGVQRLALTDELTGLANRRALYVSAEQALIDRDPEGAVGLALLDLDRFKEVNDSLGHQAGDQLLQLVTAQLKVALDAFHPGAVLARLGGDEFAVLVPDASTAAEVTAVAEHLRGALRNPLQLGNMATLHVRFSTGVAVAPQHADNRMDLMRCADLAMYAAKAVGTGRVHLYHPNLSRDSRDSRDSLKIAEDLHRAIENHELTLAYQPQVDLRGTVRGAEALVRWERPHHGPVKPDDFLPIAQNHQLMPALTRSVLSMALLDCAAWRKLGHDLTVAVNLSASDLHDAALPVLVRDTLAEHGVPAGALVLEITETNVMVNPARAERTLGFLHELGVVLSVDDYGTGHCSLSYLRRLPVQELKLDRSFLRDMATEPRDEAIMQSIVALAHSLGMRLVAEGVEDAAAAQLLAAAGCDLAQGWHFARPMPLTDLLDWLQQGSHSNVRQLRPA